MKSKRNPERADRENPAWTKQTFGRARKPRDVLPEIGKSTAAKMLKPRGRPKSGKARTSISLRLPPENAGALESYWPRMADPNGRSASESTLELAINVQWLRRDPFPPVREGLVLGSPEGLLALCASGIEVWCGSYHAPRNDNNDDGDWGVLMGGCAYVSNG